MHTAGQDHMEVGMVPAPTLCCLQSARCNTNHITQCTPHHGTCSFFWRAMPARPPPPRGLSSGPPVYIASSAASQPSALPRRLNICGELQRTHIKAST